MPEEEKEAEVVEEPVVEVVVGTMLRALSDSEKADLLNMLAPYTGRNVEKLLWRDRVDASDPRTAKGFGIDDATDIVYYDTYDAVMGGEPTSNAVVVGTRDQAGITLADSSIPLLEQCAMYKVKIAPVGGAGQYDLKTRFGSTTVYAAVDDITPLAPPLAHALVIDAKSGQSIGFGYISHNTSWTQPVDKQGALVECGGMIWTAAFLGNVAYKVEVSKLEAALKGDGGKQKILDGAAPSIRIWPELHEQKVLTKKPISFEEGEEVIDDNAKSVVEQLGRTMIMLAEVIQEKKIALDLKYKIECTPDKPDEEDGEEELEESKARALSRARAIVDMLVEELAVPADALVAAAGTTAAPGCTIVSIVP
jgi:hypothetical protein